MEHIPAFARGMARQSGWRRYCPEAVRKAQSDALHGPPLFLLRQTGPAAFVIKDERQKKPVQVLLSDPHSCSCREFRAQKELCLHLCWALLKKLQMRPDSPLSYQLGLTSREITELIQGKSDAIPRKPPRKKVISSSVSLPEVPQRPVTSQGICPICLEELLSRRIPVTRCRYGCGNPVHIKCMGVVAKHQVSSCSRMKRKTPEELMLTCPLCRGDFGTLAAFLEESRNAPCTKPTGQKHGVILPSLQAQHPDITCISCRANPIKGSVYRCVRCPYVLLCAACVLDEVMLSLHGTHGLAVRQRPGDRWQELRAPLEDSSDVLLEIGFQNTMKTVQSDSPLNTSRSSSKRANALSEELVHELPVYKIREGHKLLARGHQCCLCLNPYKVRQTIHVLPCGHQFHENCSTKWLLNVAGTCPIDGTLLKPFLLHKALQRQFTGGGAVLAQSKKQRPLTSLRPTTSRTLLAPPPPEVSVRQLPLVDRRELERSAANAARANAPRYLCRAGDERDRRRMSHHVAPNRAYALPVRPLGSMWRRTDSKTPPIISMIEAHRREMGLDNERGGRLFGRRSPNDSRSTSPVSMSVTSLRLPEDIRAHELGEGPILSPTTSVTYCWGGGGGSVESQLGLDTPPRLKPLPSARLSAGHRRRAFLSSYSEELVGSTLATRGKARSLSPGLSVTCTSLKLAVRGSNSGGTSLGKKM